MAKAHGPRIKAARGFAGGISTAALASRLGVSDSTVKRWEKGDPSLTAGYRLAIASVCQVPPEFIEGGWGPLGRDELTERLGTVEATLTAIQQRLDALATSDDLAAAVTQVAQGLDAESSPEAPARAARGSSQNRSRRA